MTRIREEEEVQLHSLQCTSQVMELKHEKIASLQDPLPHLKLVKTFQIWWIVTTTSERSMNCPLRPRA